MIRAGIASPVGRLAITIAEGAITGLTWADAPTAQDPLAHEAARQLAAYFARERETFDLPLNPGGSSFQQAFYAALCAIPYGQTRTYGDLARALCVPAQAIGQACGANPIPILIPCHRVLGSCGLGGFSGGQGIETKVALLRLESAASLLI